MLYTDLIHGYWDSYEEDPMSTRVKYDATVWNRLRGRVAELGGKTVRVGVVGPGSSAKVEGASLTMGDLARIHEYGAPGANIPERSFLRRTMIEHQAEIADVAGKAAAAVVLRDMPPAQALGLVGLRVASLVKGTITEGAGIAPALAPSTIEAKGSSRPLVDHGQLINSITFEVVDVPPGDEAA